MPPPDCVFRKERNPKTVTPNKQQLIAYFSGALPPDQKRQIEIWLSDNPDGPLVDECIRIVMEGETTEYTGEVSAETREAYARFREMTKVNKPSRKPVFLRWSMTAAAALLLLVVGMEWYRHMLLGQHQQKLSMLPKQRRYEAARAAVTRITLGDGSVVRLFPGSTLILSDSFNLGDRVVSLQGRGFFEVTHNSTLPFYVRSGSISTRVLGTAFDVDAGNRTDTRIVVKEGRVQVAGTASIFSELTRGQSISVNKASGRWRVASVNPDEYFSWTNGELGFRETPLRDILPSLEAWFNVSFHVRRPALLDKKLTFFIRRQQLREAMDVLSATGGFTYQVQSDTAIIIH